MPLRRRAQRLLIIGAGPAGLQAAIAANRAGHEVKILERSKEAGGSLALAASVPSRAEIGDLVRNQLIALEASGTVIDFGYDVDLALIEELRPDIVVIATGSQPRVPYFLNGYSPTGEDGLRSNDIVSFLADHHRPQGRVCIYDEIGFHHATSAALMLAELGCDVTIISPQLSVGQGLGVTLDAETWTLHANRLGIKLRPETLLTGHEGRTLNLLRHTDQQVTTIETDWLIVSNHPLANDALYTTLKAAHISARLLRIGDALAPRRAHQAVIEGELIGELL